MLQDVSLYCPDTAAAARLLAAPPGRVRATRSHTATWNGVTAEVTELHGPGAYLDELRSRRMRLVVTLEEVGGHTETRLRPDRPTRAAYCGAHHLSLVPADLPVWGYADEIRYFRRMLLAFDAASVESIIDAPHAVAPRLMFSDARVWRLAELIAAESTEPAPLSQLYADSLAAALLVAVLRPVPEAASASRSSSGLAPWQLRRVTAHIEDHVCQSIQLRELAAMTGLSQSHFGRAFKASTGMPPHRWQLEARVRRAQRLLVEADMPLAQVALETGFAEQSHFTRVFRRIAGTTPRAWQRERRA
jgi:AraC-like DNA-binding protein